MALQLAKLWGFELMDLPKPEEFLSDLFQAYSFKQKARVVRACFQANYHPSKGYMSLAVRIVLKSSAGGYQLLQVPIENLKSLWETL